eukprot:686699-Rhodomonas_salina.1
MGQRIALAQMLLPQVGQRAYVVRRPHSCDKRPNSLHNRPRPLAEGWASLLLHDQKSMHER